MITADMIDFSPDGRYDRIVSVEMFEHMRNHRELFRRIAGWLRDDGRLFVHLFCHREQAYLFEADGDNNWMGRYFFTGGLMPSLNMPYCFNEHLTVERHWRVCGTHYQRTCEDWQRVAGRPLHDEKKSNLTERKPQGEFDLPCRKA